MSGKRASIATLQKRHKVLEAHRHKARSKLYALDAFPLFYVPFGLKLRTVFSEYFIFC